MKIFENLKSRWKVNGWQLFLILWVFAITGTATAWLTRQVTHWFNLEPESVWYWILKISMLVIGYPVLLLLVSVLFGQTKFFLRFLKRMFRLDK